MDANYSVSQLKETPWKLKHLNETFSEAWDISNKIIPSRHIIYTDLDNIAIWQSDINFREITANN